MSLEIDEDEAMSFLGDGDANGTSRKRGQLKNGTSVPQSAWTMLSWQRWALSLLGIALVISSRKFIFAARDGEAVESGGGVADKTPTVSDDASGSSSINTPTRGSSAFLPANLNDINQMISKFHQAKQEFINKLQVDYGRQYYQTIFEKNVNGTNYSKGRLAFRPATEGGPSWDRLKRKVMMRLLEVQLAFQQRRRRGLGTLMEQILETDPGTIHYRLPRREGYVPFIWATGGHSAACGHGNFYNESYTAVMESGVKDIFAAVGLEFIARNYAMGGTGSGPEVAMCIDPIFGQDIDVLSWDFGLTDGTMSERIAMYFTRAGLNPSRPACVTLHHGNRKGTLQTVAEVEEMGLASILLDETIFKSMIDSLPDTADGLTQKQIDEMPPFVRYFRCGSLIEKGDPGCGDHKFDTSVCGTRKYKTSWHPGRKWHALAGNLMSLFMTEILDDALQEIASSSLSAGDLFLELKASEDADYDHFKASDPPTKAVAKFPIPDGIDKKLIFMGPNWCHSAKLPSESRYYGVLTEDTSHIGYDNYFIGISQEEAMLQFTKDSGAMQLVYKEDLRQECEIPLNIDHKDWYQVHYQEGWKSLTLPNDSEIKMYGDGTTPQLKGIIAVCFRLCDWGTCPTGNLRRDEFHSGWGEIQVNGKPVANLTQADKCDFLQSDEGYYWKPDSNGRFEIRARALEPDTYFRFGAFIIW